MATIIEDRTALEAADEILRRNARTSREIEEVQRAVQLDHQSATEAAADAERAAEDPALTAEQAREARHKGEDARHEVRRLAAADERLSEALDHAQDEEHRARQREDWERHREARAELVGRVRTEVPAALAVLAEIAGAIAETDAASADLNRHGLPEGAKPFGGIEGEVFAYPDPVDGAVPASARFFRLCTLPLPDGRHMDQLASPPLSPLAADALRREMPDIGHVRQSAKPKRARGKR